MKVRMVAAYANEEGNRRFRICVRPDGLFQVATEQFISDEYDSFAYWLNEYPPSGIYRSVDEAKDAIPDRPLNEMAVTDFGEFDPARGPYPNM